MKNINTVLAGCFLFLSYNVKGQTTGAPKLRIQVEAGISSANMYIDPKIFRLDPFTGKAIIKVTPGIGAQLKLGRSTNFEFAIHHYQAGTRYFERKNYREEFLLKYVRLYTNFKYQLINGKHRSNLFITAGPYLSFLGSGTFTYNGFSMIAHKGPLKSFKRFDYGLSCSIGYMTPAGVYTRVSYAQGLNKVNIPVDENDQRVLKNINNWMFNIGYQF